MFGHDDNSKKTDDANDTMVTDDVLHDTDDTNSPAYIPTPPGQPVQSSDDASTAAPVSDVPPVDDQPAENAAPDDVMPAEQEPAQSAPFIADDEDGLLGIKQDALQQLSPLVGHLNQTPEEKFRTTMMMIQASDDQTLIKEAYQAAQAITDDKTRAQALLDIINEINYFTRQG